MCNATGLWLLGGVEPGNDRQSVISRARDDDPSGPPDWRRNKPIEMALEAHTSPPEARLGLASGGDSAIVRDPRPNGAPLGRGTRYV